MEAGARGLLVLAVARAAPKNAGSGGRAATHSAEGIVVVGCVVWVLCVNRSRSSSCGSLGILVCKLTSMCVGGRTRQLACWRQWCQPTTAHMNLRPQHQQRRTTLGLRVHSIQSSCTISGALGREGEVHADARRAPSIQAKGAAFCGCSWQQVGPCGHHISLHSRSWATSHTRLYAPDARCARNVADHHCGVPRHQPPPLS